MLEFKKKKKKTTQSRRKTKASARSPRRAIAPAQSARKTTGGVRRRGSAGVVRVAAATWPAFPAEVAEHVEWLLQHLRWQRCAVLLPELAAVLDANSTAPPSSASRRRSARLRLPKRPSVQARWYVGTFGVEAARKLLKDLTTWTALARDFQEGYVFLQELDAMFGTKFVA